jgi:hypothetical protein
VAEVERDVGMTAGEVMAAAVVTDVDMDMMAAVVVGVMAGVMMAAVVATVMTAAVATGRSGCGHDHGSGDRGSGGKRKDFDTVQHGEAPSGFGCCSASSDRPHVGESAPACIARARAIVALVTRVTASAMMIQIF